MVQFAFQYSPRSFTYNMPYEQPRCRHTYQGLCWLQRARCSSSSPSFRSTAAGHQSGHLRWARGSSPCQSPSEWGEPGCTARNSKEEVKTWSKKQRNLFNWHSVSGLVVLVPLGLVKQNNVVRFVHHWNTGCLIEKFLKVSQQKPAWRPFHFKSRASSCCWHYCCDI